jgi:hypothetical protein
MGENMTNALKYRLRRALGRWRRGWKREPDLPADPFANRMAPVRRGPRGRSGAAVAEPDEEFFTDAQSQRRRKA